MGNSRNWGSCTSIIYLGFVLASLTCLPCGTRKKQYIQKERALKDLIWEWVDRSICLFTEGVVGGEVILRLLRTGNCKSEPPPASKGRLPKFHLSICQPFWQNSSTEEIQVPLVNS